MTPDNREDQVLNWNIEFREMDERWVKFVPNFEFLYRKYQSKQVGFVSLKTYFVFLNSNS